jgi:transcriptional regulator with XRE-family HTH domain
MRPHNRQPRRTVRQIQVDDLAERTVRRLGTDIRLARLRRRITQEDLSAAIGISRASQSRIELGRGRGVPVRIWLALALELGLTPRFELQRDWREETSDAGHLAIQDLILRMGRATGYDGSFELATRSQDPSRSIDVCLRSDRQRRLIVAEAWNTIGDVGAGARSFQRKLAEAAQLAVAIGGDQPYLVHGLWVVRATARNRDLVARYPHVFRAAFAGSSARWVEALTTGSPPPKEPGLVWCDTRATRLFAWRYSIRTPGGSSSPAGN